MSDQDELEDDDGKGFAVFLQQAAHQVRSMISSHPPVLVLVMDAKGRPAGGVSVNEADWSKFRGAIEVFAARLPEQWNGDDEFVPLDRVDA